MCWFQIKSQTDIDHLLDEYYGFHDSCIVSVNYESGARISSDGSMYGVNKNCSLIMKFESQMPKYHEHPEKKTLELKFNGLRRCNLIGYQENYFSGLIACHLSLYQGFIVWSDDDWFDPEKYQDTSLLKEPMATFVVADGLEWRFVEQ